MIGCCGTSTDSVLPLCLCWQTICYTTFHRMQFANKLLYLLPRDHLHWTIGSAFENTRIVSHHHFPLPLCHWIDAQKKRLANGDFVDRGLIFLPFAQIWR